jgi:hypothetical protein
MSIYCSRETVGVDYWHPKTKPGKPHRVGRVVAHPQNRLALVDSENWPEGSIDTAHIPAWCVPGHQEDTGEFEHISEWMRLTFDVGGMHGNVLLDEKAVRALAADLTEWLAVPKFKNKRTRTE